MYVCYTIMIVIVNQQIIYNQVVQHCVSCLGAVVNKVTHNYKFVWASFNRFYGKYILYTVFICFSFIRSLVVAFALLD